MENKNLFINNPEQIDKQLCEISLLKQSNNKLTFLKQNKTKELIKKSEIINNLKQKTKNDLVERNIVIKLYLKIFEIIIKKYKL